MGGKRTEGFLVGLLLAGSVAAVLFVFFVLREGDTGFGPRPPPSAQARQPEPPPNRANPVPSRPEPPPPKIEPAPPPAEEAPLDGPAPTEEEEPPPAPVDPLAGGRAELILELLRPKEDEDRRVVVTVADEDGFAIAGALVVVRLGSGIVFRDRATDEGVVVFQPYEEEIGPFRIDAIADYFAPGAAPEVKPGEDVTLTLRMQPWVEGTVDAPSTGHGLVTLYTERGERTQAIADDGSFLFEGVDPGWVSVVANVEPYGADSDRFLLRAGTRQVVRLKVRAKNYVPIFGEIEPWDPDARAWINGVPLPVNASGRYDFKKAVFGTNEILIDAPRKAAFRERFEVEGRRAKKYNFRLENDAAISGVVAAADTRARLMGAEVRVGFDPDNPHNSKFRFFPIKLVPVVYTDEKGRFSITRLQAGAEYTVSVVMHPYAQYLGQARAGGLGVERILLPTGPFLFGRLHGLGGVPRDAKVSAYRLLTEPDRRKFNVDRWDKVVSGRDGKGYYGLSGLVPDVYVIRADAPGYGSMETIVDLRDFDRGRMDLRIRKGQFETSTDVELLKRLPPVVESAADFGLQSRDSVTVLSVDLKRAQGKVPLPGVLVRFFEGELEFAAPMSFDEDEFDLMRLPEATYRAVLTHPLLDKPLVRAGIRLQRGKPYALHFRD